MFLEFNKHTYSEIEVLLHRFIITNEVKSNYFTTIKQCTDNYKTSHFKVEKYAIF